MAMSAHFGAETGASEPSATHFAHSGEPVDPTKRVKDFDEATIIRWLQRLAPTGGAVVGIGDDAAVLPHRHGYPVVTTDAMVEGIDFRRDWSTAGEIAFKAVVQNVADIVAMRALPQELFLTLVLPEDLSAGWVREFSDGLGEGCVEFGARLTGGDLSSGPAIMVSITALGECIGDPLTRAGAQPGDRVYVTGPWGQSHVVLQRLLGGATRDQFSMEALRWHVRPQPVLSPMLVEQLAPATAGLDVSDGLARDAGRIAEASGVTVVLEPDAVQARCSELRESCASAGVAAPTEAELREAVLCGGEEHCLVVTLPAKATAPLTWRFIGHVASRGKAAVVCGDTPVGHLGWDHFGRGRDGS